MCVKACTGNHSGNVIPECKTIKYTFQICGNEEIKWKPLPHFATHLLSLTKWSYLAVPGQPAPVDKWYALPLIPLMLFKMPLIAPQNPYPPGTIDLTPNYCKTKTGPLPIP